MSQENLELIVSLQPARDVDIAQMFRNDAIVEAVATTLAPHNGAVWSTVRST